MNSSLNVKHLHVHLSFLCATWMALQFQSILFYFFTYALRTSHTLIRSTSCSSSAAIASDGYGYWLFCWTMRKDINKYQISNVFKKNRVQNIKLMRKNVYVTTDSRAQYDHQVFELRIFLNNLLVFSSAYSLTHRRSCSVTFVALAEKIYFCPSSANTHLPKRPKLTSGNKAIFSSINFTLPVLLLRSVSIALLLIEQNLYYKQLDVSHTLTIQQKVENGWFYSAHRVVVWFFGRRKVRGLLCLKRDGKSFNTEATY